MQRHGGADGHALRGAEEARDDADGGEDRVEVQRGAGEEQQQAEPGAGQVGGDERGLERPAIDEDSGEHAQDGDRQQVGDLQAGDLRAAWRGAGR